MSSSLLFLKRITKFVESLSRQKRFSFLFSKTFNLLWRNLESWGIISVISAYINLCNFWETTQSHGTVFIAFKNNFPIHWSIQQKMSIRIVTNIYLQTSGLTLDSSHIHPLSGVWSLGHRCEFCIIYIFFIRCFLTKSMGG